jgi:hypothetical protein
MSTARGRLLTAAVVLAVAAAFVASLYQPWLSQWGSTAAERRAAVAGDTLVPNAIAWTRSITVDAPPEAVWPWLVQIGYDKGGFYNYDWGEQLTGDPIHNATRIHPEWQRLEPGDHVYPAPVGSPWTVEQVEHGRLLVLGGDQGRWSWATELRPLPGDRTRVVTRVRSHKGSVFSYVLDPADLILFPRLLTGLKQRAEGTLPGMPGTHVGAPLPLARLPVHWWAALAWVAGLAVLAAAGRGPLGLGRWRRRRPHPGITLAVGFVAGAGYLLMSDTPPWRILTRNWGAGVVLGVLLGRALARLARPEWERRDRRRTSRGITAVAETGLFVVLPVTAVWQAATALGLTTSPGAHVIVGLVATATATAVAGPGWGGSSSGPVVAVVLAAGYAATGAGLLPLLGALIFELAGGRRAVTVVALPTPEPAPARHLRFVRGGAAPARRLHALDATERRPR